MSLPGLTWILRLIAVAGVLCSLAGVVLLVVAGERGLPFSALLIALTLFAVVVWVISPTQSRNVLTWVLASFVLLVGTYPLAQGINSLVWPGLEIPPFGEPMGDLPAAFVLSDGIVSAMGSTGGFLLLTFGLLLFPDGRLPSRRWRWAAYYAAIAVGGWLLVSLYAAIPANADYLRESAVAGYAYAALILSAPPCLISLFFRYRNSDWAMRHQIKWIVWGALVGVLGTVISYAGGPDLGGILGFLVLAATYGIAITRYQLFDIDVIISRTVVLAMLAAFITLVYALVVVGVGRALGGGSNGLLLPILATGIVAVAFEPVRHRAQGWANRVVYGRRATPYEVLADLTERLSHAEKGDALLERIAERLSAGTSAERVTVWLGDEGTMTVAASAPTAPDPSTRLDLGAEHVFPVTHDDVVVGAFEVLEPRGSTLSSADRSLIENVAGSAGALLGYHRLNDSLRAKAEELAESRGRLVDAQDSERRRLERDLHDGAQQLIVALKVRIGLARNLAAKHQAGELVSLLDGLTEETQSALEEVRALARGIYPPVLESDGLESAISSLVSGLSDEVMLRCRDLGRYERDVEAAVYFEVSEAITNAVKHASGPIRVEIVGSETEVRFSVADSGPGFDVAAANGGSGLQNLRDRVDAMGGRVEIDSHPGDRTTVRGSIPLLAVLV